MGCMTTEHVLQVRLFFTYIQPQSYSTVILLIGCIILSLNSEKVVKIMKIGFTREANMDVAQEYTKDLEHFPYQSAYGQMIF